MNSIIRKCTRRMRGPLIHSSQHISAMPTTVSGVETDVVTLGTLHDLSAKESTYRYTPSIGEKHMHPDSSNLFVLVNESAAKHQGRSTCNPSLSVGTITPSVSTFCLRGSGISPAAGTGGNYGVHQLIRQLIPLVDRSYILPPELIFSSSYIA